MTRNRTNRKFANTTNIFLMAAATVGTLVLGILVFLVFTAAAAAQSGILPALATSSG